MVHNVRATCTLPPGELRRRELACALPELPPKKKVGNKDPRSFRVDPRVGAHQRSADNR